MHDHAHDELPHKIIEVDENIVESFLGRIEDPENIDSTDLNIIDDSAFRIIMVLEFRSKSLINSDQIYNHLQSFNRESIDIVENFNGRVVKQNSRGLLISFSSVLKGVYCAREIQTKFDKYILEVNNSKLNLRISL